MRPSSSTRVAVAIGDELTFRQECRENDQWVTLWESEEEKFKKNMFYTPKVNQKSLETSLAMLMLLGFIR